MTDYFQQTYSVLLVEHEEAELAFFKMCRATQVLSGCHTMNEDREMKGSEEIPQPLNQRVDIRH